MTTSFFDDPATKAFFARRPLYEQKYLWSFNLCGDLTECEAHCHDYVPQRRGTRGIVTGFSRRSRLRLLKWCSTLDASACSTGEFVTLTYPDDVVGVDPHIRTRHKFRFMRYWENHLGRELGCMWRLEWMPRLSGRRLGEIAPHFHLIVPGVPHIQESFVREWWARSLMWKDYVDVDARPLNDKKHHALYVAKYCTKPADLPTLGYVPYSHTRGRHWGINKPQLIPRCEKLRFENVPWTVVEAIRKLAYEKLRPEQQDPCKGFSCFGQLGAKIKAFALKCLLDSGCVPV